MATGIDPQLIAGDAWQQPLEDKLAEMQSQNFLARFWQKDPTLWRTDAKPEDISGFMGWIDIAERLLPQCDDLTTFAQEVKDAGFQRVVLAGMGGSSLAPLVLKNTLASGSGLPLDVLDSTDPVTILRIERAGPLDKTLFIISSKSGTTAEPQAFDHYFFDKVKALKGDAAGENFVAITDPGTLLASEAAARGFRRTFINFADIGGRFSALSYFGLVPAALMGINVRQLLDDAVAMAQANGPSVRAQDAPAVRIGALLGLLAKQGRDKLTFLLPDELKTMGLWLEQLVAESTGKHGTGIFPIAGEEPGPPSVYGDDRVFAYGRREGTDCTFLDMRVAALRDEGHPILTFDLHDFYCIGQEFMRWEIATAVAGSVLEINPFDQPNVQESKDITKRVIAEVEQQGHLQPENPDVEIGDIAIYGVPGATGMDDALQRFLGGAGPGNYVSLMAYLTESDDMTQTLAKLQAEVRDDRHTATAMGYGPRFLHSTGQFHKGGPNSGYFIQFTAAIAEDTPVPGKPYTFGVFRDAQAIGDRQALLAKGRRVMRIHLGRDPIGALKEITQTIEALRPVTSR